MGDVFCKAMERVEQRLQKPRMVAAMAPLQVGIGLPGGPEVASSVVEAFLRIHPDKHGLNVDIRNMHNELCRVNMLEPGRELPRAGQGRRSEKQPQRHHLLPQLFPTPGTDR